MSTAPPPPGIRDALLNRRKEIRKRLDVLNGKAVRRMLESDLGLEAKQLDPFKALVDNLIDEVVIGRSKDSQEDSQQQPPDTQPSRDQGDKYNDLAVTKDQARKPTPKTKAEPKAKPARKKASAQRKSKGLSDDESGEEEEEDTGSGSGSDEDQEVRPPPRKVSKANAKPAVKEPAGGPKFSKQVERLREICKKATIKIPPALYKRGPDGSEDRMLEGLEGLLAKHGLDANSKDSEIKAAKKQIERMRELEGIDTSNIMEAAGRRPRRAAASINFRAIYNQMGEGDSDAEGQEEEEMEQLRGGSKGGGSSEEGGEDAARGGQTKRRSKGSAGGGAQKRGRSADAHDMQGMDEEKEEEEGEEEGDGGGSAAKRSRSQSKEPAVRETGGAAKGAEAAAAAAAPASVARSVQSWGSGSEDGLEDEGVPTPAAAGASKSPSSGSEDVKKKQRGVGRRRAALEDEEEEEGKEQGRAHKAAATVAESDSDEASKDASLEEEEESDFNPSEESD